MADNIKTIAASLGAKVVASVPDTARLVPGQGRRAGRPTNPRWVRHPKAPMSEATKRRQTHLARQASSGGRKVSPMQLAAQILEDALANIPES